MTEQVWWSANTIRFSRKQIKWLVPYFSLLRAGSYPRNPKDTGYQDPPIRTKSISTEAKFIKAAEIYAELSLRIERAGTRGDRIHDGLLLELLYSTDPDDELATTEHISAALGISIPEVARRIRNALAYVSGTGRKVSSYSSWLRDRKPATKQENRPFRGGQ